ncbi:Inosine-uridine preferring nucleoside hydrolase [Musa troglodytarum]|uniref:Inosine-uridine preferring nucleoside hydrolase n=1 Tax=Musa troglodytarum TaxID=320322 RepID=A0A9E7IBW5_9LILI|nr:Inosine-uridine preferring nucleoside hydrolase [Musa troglodytarum]URE49426.1 Inosine-uridine preferring nucleoside hydrolase [Musa troglodytarum]
MMRTGRSVALLFLVLMEFLGWKSWVVEAKPRRILLDTDMDTDDFFALLYLLKQNPSQFDLKAITISAIGWTDAGHAVNHVYDILYMMNRDDIPVGVGGDGGILDDGTILPHVGGYLPLIEQGMSTAGDCRYRQAIPVGGHGRLDVNTNYGLRRSFLPQGRRRYIPLQQSTAQKVLIDTVAAGPTVLLVIGSHTNIALFLMTNPHLKKNIEHIYIMGGGVRSKNPCCTNNASTSCEPQYCDHKGNLFTGYTSNPYAEFNIFGDPFAAYQVFHTGIPVTLVPLDSTNTIPINEEFFDVFQQQQETFEAQYCFKSLKIIRDNWFDNGFYTSYFMWDSFASGVAISIMSKEDNYDGENEIAEMKYLNITVVTSNEPYGVRDGSNPFFDGRAVPKFNLQKAGVHSGHVQTGLQDPFCIVKGSDRGICQDGYTKEVAGPEAVQVLVAQEAKPNQDVHSPLNRQFFKSFLDVLNAHNRSGRFNFTTQFPYYREILYKPNITNRTRGRPVVLDMDMSAGDFLALIYLLKVPVEVVDLKGILVSGNGWATAATIDIIYDVLHMMGRDDVPVGLGNLTALGTPSLGCKYVKAIPQGSGGLLDSDTLYGLARTLPRSPRSYTVENSERFGALGNTDQPQLRQALALEVWQSISRALQPGEKLTVLTNGPLTNLANIIDRDECAAKVIEDVYIVGGQAIDGKNKTGNVFTVPSNKFAEFNMFLDPLAAKKVMESNLRITLIPLSAQQKVCSFERTLQNLKLAEKTPESIFAHSLLSLLYELQQERPKLYRHMEIFLGEVLGAVFLVEHSKLNPTMQTEKITVLTGNMSLDGQITVDKRYGKLVNIVDEFDSEAYYKLFADLLGDKQQSAVIGSFDEQQKIWRTPPK